MWIGYPLERIINPLIVMYSQWKDDPHLESLRWITRSTMGFELITLDKAGEQVKQLYNFQEGIPCWLKTCA